MITSRRLIPLLLLIVLPYDTVSRRQWSLPTNIGRTARLVESRRVTSISQNAPTRITKTITVLGVTGGDTTVSGGITSGDQSTEGISPTTESATVDEATKDVSAVKEQETEPEAVLPVTQSLSGGASTTASVTDTPVSSGTNSFNTSITLDEHEAATTNYIKNQFLAEAI